MGTFHKNIVLHQCFPNQGSDYVSLPSIFCVIIIIIIQNNIVVLFPRYPPKNCILPLGVIYPHFGNHCITSRKAKAELRVNTPSVHIKLLSHLQTHTPPVKRCLFLAHC